MAVTANPLDAIQTKMEASGVAQPAIDAFLGAVMRVQSGETGLLPEAAIEPLDETIRHEELPEVEPSDSKLLEQLAVIKLNGGLGTGMGLDGPKSLLPIRGADTFLDFIARQILRLRGGSSENHPAFLLMNSFSTRSESLEYLSKYTELPNADGSLDFVQNKVPKLDPDSLLPVNWPDVPALEWCPPGHGDLYPSLLGNDDLLERLLAGGIRYLFVANADNLGATVDLKLLRHFADSKDAFLMEVAERTEVDRKGGHLARRRSDGRLVLREAAQCPVEDRHRFQDVDRHRFFNTNNLWIRLDAVREALRAGNGAIALPLIINRKTVNPQDPTSTPVLQLESAMGAAIECFDQAGAVQVPRSRFAPVKTTNDLLGVRSDAYVTDEDNTVLRLDDERQGVPPRIDLDPEYYKLVGPFDELCRDGLPSLIDCASLHVRGPVRFQPGTLIEGEVTIINRSADVKTLPAGTHSDETVEL
jgi:UDP-N-acetylglucosamine pyrophosphorylase